MTIDEKAKESKERAESKNSMSTDTAIKQKIREFIAETFLIGDEKDSFDNADSFMTTGIVDSTGILEITVYLESEFEMTIEDDEMTPSNLDSVNNLAGFVMRKTG